MRRHAPATERNREPILAVLRELMPPDGTVLEVSSGSGQHAAFFATHFPNLVWQPSDPDGPSRASIDAWCAEVPNVRPAIELDVRQRPWPIANADVIVNINMIHIAPWEACEALFMGAADVLPTGGHLYMYGPYQHGGSHTAPSNAAFDARLRGENPAWGVRPVEDVVRTAEGAGFMLDRIVEMPANNLSVIYRRAN
ncbi:MAG: DUF938 domain-containing protein [Myxococcales bacterium]|nr:DUF938 domain-containing protein [Myxococcales bacterium]